MDGYTIGHDGDGREYRFPDDCPHCGAGCDWSGRTMFFIESSLLFDCGGCGKRFAVRPQPDAVLAEET